MLSEHAVERARSFFGEFVSHFLYTTDTRIGVAVYLSIIANIALYCIVLFMPREVQQW